MPEFAFRTDPGRIRPNNEDAFLAVRLDAAVLLAVADGLGGQRAGEVASALAVRVLEQEMRAAAGSRPPGDRLADALRAANRAVWQSGEAEAAWSGMATTLVAAIVDGASAWIANVGDSRACLLRGGRLQQISDDHSLVAESLREGEITAAEARHSSLKHVVTRTIGSEPSVDVDLFGPLRLGAGDTLLLSSDGLHDVLDPDEIAAIAPQGDLEAAAQSLVDTANAAGGPDNITVVLYRAQ